VKNDGMFFEVSALGRVWLKNHGHCVLLIIDYYLK
jgi:hypothetical protein